MRGRRVNIRRIGNSRGVVIPKPVLAISNEGDALALRGPASPVRRGWAEADQKIAEAGDDGLVMGEFGNAADADLTW